MMLLRLVHNSLKIVSGRNVFVGSFEEMFFVCICGCCENMVDVIAIWSLRCPGFDCSDINVRPLKINAYQILVDPKLNVELAVADHYLILL